MAESIDVQLARVNRGDKINVEVSNDSWAKPFAVIATDVEQFQSAISRSRFAVGMLALAYESPPGTRYDIEIDADGDARMFRRRDDGSGYLAGLVESVDDAGQLSFSTRAQLADPEELGFESTPEGDDTWRELNEKVRTDGGRT